MCNKRKKLTETSTVLATMGKVCNIDGLFQIRPFAMAFFRLENCIDPAWRKIKSKRKGTSWLQEVPGPPLLKALTQQRQQKAGHKRSEYSYMMSGRSTLNPPGSDLPHRNKQ